MGSAIISLMEVMTLGTIMIGCGTFISSVIIARIEDLFYPEELWIIHPISREKTYLSDLWDTDRLNSTPLSLLIKMAVAAMYQIEKDPNIEIYMGTFCSFKMNPETRESHIQVCFAGSIAAKYASDFHTFLAKGDLIGDDIPNYMVALDYLKNGLVDGALMCLGKRRPQGVAWKIKITPYNKDPKRFKTDMWLLAEYLQERGC